VTVALYPRPISKNLGGCDTPTTPGLTPMSEAWTMRVLDELIERDPTPSSVII